MNIWFMIEKEYESSFWCRETIRGIRTQAVVRKYNLRKLSMDQMEKMKKTESPIVILVVGTSVIWINRVTKRILDKGFKCILVSSNYTVSDMERVTALSLDYYRSMRMSMSYLENMGSRRIAFFGANPNSYADQCKISVFPRKQDVYFNYGSVLACTLQIWEKIENYDAIICANDAVAIYLLRFLQKRNKHLPGEIRIVSFGDFLLSRFMPTPIISIELDFFALGKQAVNIYAFQVKNPQLILNAFVECTIRIRGLTGERWLLCDSDEKSAEFECSEINFYDDEPIRYILSLEKLLSDSDALDFQILSLLLNKSEVTLDRMAQMLNLSLSSLHYRINKMKAGFENHSLDNMLRVVREYFSEEALQRIMEWKKTADQ